MKSKVWNNNSLHHTFSFYRIHFNKNRCENLKQLIVLKLLFRWPIRYITRIFEKKSNISRLPTINAFGTRFHRDLYDIHFEFWSFFFQIAILFFFSNFPFYLRDMRTTKYSYFRVWHWNNRCLWNIFTQSYDQKT